MNSRRAHRLNSLLKVFVLTFSLFAVGNAQNNPVPQIVGPVHPDAVAPGGGDFTLSVYGANFVPGAVVDWNYSPRTTTFVSAHEIQAEILASDIAHNTAGYVTVVNPAPGGGSSSASWAQVEVHDPIFAVTMGSPVSYAIAYPLAADFTNDGTLDLIGEYGYGLILDKGNDKGAFTYWSTAGYQYLPGSEFSYGDFTGDGNIDVVLVQGQATQKFPTQMNVMLGDGAGNFSAGPITTSPFGLGLTVVGDFNQDGKLDLVTVGKDAAAVFLGNGDGTFDHSTNYPYALLTYQMLAGDFNGDGKLDLVILEEPLRPHNNEGGVALWYLQGNGDGTFQPPHEITSVLSGATCVGGDFRGALQLSDLNGDGNLDAAFCIGGEVGALLGNGDGTFQAPIFTRVSSSYGFGFAIGDMNSDGIPDLVVSNFPVANDSQMVIYLGSGDGTFEQSQTMKSYGASDGVTVGDFNSDGLLDCIFVTGIGAEVYIQQ